MRGKIIMFSLLTLFILGCNKKESPYLYVLNNNESTNIASYDKDLKQIKDYQLKDNISIPNNKNIVKDNNLYDLKYSPKLNNIVQLNLESRRIKNININNKENPQVFDYNNSTLVYSSNFIKNNKLYLKQNNKEKSCEYKDYFFNHLIINNNRLFALTTYQNKKEYLLEIDINSLKIINEALLNNSSSINTHPIIVDNTIYFIDTKNYLNMYDINNKTLSKHHLKLSNPGKMYYDNKKIYITNSDNLSMNDVDKSMYIYNTINKKGITTNLPHITYDFLIDRDAIYLLGQQEISKINKKDFKLVSKTTLKSNQIPIKIIKAKD